MPQYLKYFQKKLKQWKDKRFLKKHRCETWEQYNYKFDPDCNQRATRIRDYYHGYKHWMVIQNRNHYAYHWDVHEDGIYVLSEWCKENLDSKFRFDFHRVMNAPATAHEWEINELGGSDYILFACQDERDFIWFTMRWA